MRKEEIIKSLESEFERGVAILNDLDEGLANLRPIPKKWTIAEEFYHILKANAALGSGLKQGKLFYMSMGENKHAPRTFEEVVDDYKLKLEARQRANPISVFTTTDPEKLDLEGMKKHWEMTITKLRERLGKWDEKEMDKRRLPHPLLGKIAVREMLYFTIFHTQHHLRSIEEKAKKT